MKLDVKHMVSQMKLQDRKPKQVLQMKLYAIHIFTLNRNLQKIKNKFNFACKNLDIKNSTFKF
jgi:hypothetical protein